MSKDMVAWRKKEVVELTKDAVNLVKILINYWSKALSPTKETNIIAGLMGKCRNAQTEDSTAPGSKKACFLLSVCPSRLPALANLTQLLHGRHSRSFWYQLEPTG